MEVRKQLSNVTVASVLLGTPPNWNGSQKGDKTVNVSFGIDTSIYTITSVVLTCHLSNSVGGTHQINNNDVKPNSDITLELPKENVQDIYFYFRVSRYIQATQSYQSVTFSNIVVTATYGINESKCTPPTSFGTSKSACPADGHAKLTWDGAVSGEAHAITGYQIQCKAKTADGAWSPVAEWKDVATTGVVNEYTVTPSANISSVISGDVEGCSVKYRIRAITDNAQWNSNWLEGVFTITVSETAKQQPLQILPPYKTVRIWRRIE